MHSSSRPSFIDAPGNHATTRRAAFQSLTGYNNNHSRYDEEEAQAYLEPRPPVAAAAADDLGRSEDHHRGRPLPPHTPVRLHFVAAEESTVTVHFH